MRCALMVVVLLAACRGEEIQVEAPKRPEHYRPSWTLELGLHTAAMAACLEGREAPRHVAFLEPLPSGATGVSTVDAYGALEHCAYSDGRVVHREPAGLSPTELEGLPVFSLGPVTPIAPIGVVLEEIFEDGHTVGWLWWPSDAKHVAAADDEPLEEGAP